jgi:hypothetical protein
LASPYPDRSRVDLGRAGRDGGALVMTAGPVGARAVADQLGEPRAERPQQVAADRHANLGHLKVTPPQQRLGLLDPAHHQVAVGRLPEGSANAAGAMARRHEGRPCQRRNIQRHRVVAVHQVTGPVQPDQAPNVTRPPSHSARRRRCRRRRGLAARMRRRPGTPRHCRGPPAPSPTAASPPASMRPSTRPAPEALTGQLKRSTTATMNITSYGWSI